MRKMRKTDMTHRGAGLLAKKKKGLYLSVIPVKRAV